MLNKDYEMIDVIIVPGGTHLKPRLELSTKLGKEKTIIYCGYGNKENEKDIENIFLDKNIQPFSQKSKRGFKTIIDKSIDTFWQVAYYTKGEAKKHGFCNLLLISDNPWEDRFLDTCERVYGYGYRFNSEAVSTTRGTALIYRLGLEILPRAESSLISNFERLGYIKRGDDERYKQLDKKIMNLLRPIYMFSESIHNPRALVDM